MTGSYSPVSSWQLQLSLLRYGRLSSRTDFAGGPSCDFGVVIDLAGCSFLERPSFFEYPKTYIPTFF